MFEQLESAGTGQGAFILDKSGQSPRTIDQQHDDATKHWPERRTKAFQRDESSNIVTDEYVVEQPEQEPQWTQEAPPVSVQSNFNAPQVPSGYVESSRPEHQAQWTQQVPPTPIESISIAQRVPQILMGSLRPEQQIQWTQQAPPMPIQSKPGVPRVPPGFTESSPRYMPFGMLPDRTTPPRDRQISASSSSTITALPKDRQPRASSNNTIIAEKAGDSIQMYRSTAAQSLLSLPTRPEKHSTDTRFPCCCIHCQPRDLVVLSNKKRTADGSHKQKHFRINSGGMILLTPPTSPRTDAARGRADPFNCYSVEWQPWFDQILHHSKYAPFLNFHQQPAKHLFHSDGNIRTARLARSADHARTRRPMGMVPHPKLPLRTSPLLRPPPFRFRRHDPAGSHAHRIHVLAARPSHQIHQ